MSCSRSGRIKRKSLSEGERERKQSVDVQVSHLNGWVRTGVRAKIKNI